MLPSDREAPGTETLAIVSDKRARHFWDAAGVLPPLFQRPLGLPDRRLAWDVYLIYPPGTRWKDEPPAPLYWEHQLARSIHQGPPEGLVPCLWDTLEDPFPAHLTLPGPLGPAALPVPPASPPADNAFLSPALPKTLPTASRQSGLPRFSFPDPRFSWTPPPIAPPASETSPGSDYCCTARSSPAAGSPSLAPRF
jgi:hypothetical protein